MDAMTAELVGYLVIIAGLLIGLLVLSYKHRNDYGTMSEEWLERHR